MCVVLAISVSVVLAEEPEQHMSVEEVRTQSGVDPTRVASKLGFSTWFYDKEAGNVQINNRIGLTSGIGNWSFTLRLDMVSVNNVPGRSGFVSGIGNVRTTILNTFYIEGRHALAASVGFAFPTASQSVGSVTGLNNYFAVTPALTYAYTINPSLILALQPQYSFALGRGNSSLPDMNDIVVRMFVAKFWDTGMFFVFEPRPIYSFSTRRFDVILSPIVGRALDGGYTLSFLAEIPTRGTMVRNLGVLYLLGISKTF